MNRRDRRAQRIPARLLKLAACPDCDSDVAVSDCGHIEVRHDDTCPWLAALEAAGGIGVRFGRHDDGRANN